MKISCIVLAGGKSSRIKEDKAFLLLKEKPLINYVIDVVKRIFSDVIIVVKNEKQKRRLKNSMKSYSEKLKIFEDKSEIWSPLAGIKEGIKHIENEFVFIVACDMPFIKEETIVRLISNTDENVDCVVPIQDEKKYEPLCAIYRKNIFKNCSLTQSLHSLIDNLQNKVLIQIKNSKSFLNINTRKDLEIASLMLS